MYFEQTVINSKKKSLSKILIYTNCTAMNWKQFYKND